MAFSSAKRKAQAWPWNVIDVVEFEKSVPDVSVELSAMLPLVPRTRGNYVADFVKATNIEQLIPRGYWTHASLRRQLQNGQTFKKYMLAM